MSKKRISSHRKRLLTSDKNMYSGGGAMLASTLANYTAAGISNIAQMYHQKFMQKQQDEYNDYQRELQNRSLSEGNDVALQQASQQRLNESQNMAAETQAKHQAMFQQQPKLFWNGGGLGFQPYQLQKPQLELPITQQKWSNPLYSQQMLDNTKNMKFEVPKLQTFFGAGNTGAGLDLNNQQSPADNKLVSDGSKLLGALGQLIGGDYHTGVGDVMSKLPGLGLIGGSVNRMFGIKTDQAELNRVKEESNYLNNAASTAGAATSFDDAALNGPKAINMNVNAYEGGWFSGGKARRKNQELKDSLIAQQQFARRSSSNSISNITDTQMDNLFANYAAFGGPIDYNLKSTYLDNMYTGNTTSKMTAMPNSFMANKGDLYNAPLMAFGGTLSSNGADWSNGLTWINNGGTHEENPYEGVPMGIDSEGKPNLVEEGEVVFDDYVFSARLTVPKTMRDKYKLKEDITFADAAKKLSKESEERPNDPISKRGLKSFMEELESYQEEIRMKKQAAEVKKKISKMSPEELQGLSQLMQGQNIQMEQQMPEQLSAEQMAQQELAQQGNAPKFAIGGKKAKYKRDWFESRAKALEFELGDNFVYNDQDDEANLSNFNALYKAAQRQKAYDTYLKGQRKNWENTELASGRYKRSDDGKSIYSAKFYEEGDLGKDYIGSDGTRISAEDYNTQLNKYNTLKAKNKLTNEEKASIAAFEKASYKKSPVVKGQFAKDYSGNTIYDYDTDVTSTWIPTDDILGSDFKWDSKDAASILFDPEKNNSTLSKLRYAPVLGGAIGLITDLASSPDYSRAEDIKRAGNISVPHVSFNPIGNYLTYRPFDINYVANQLRASEQAGMRNILNTSGGNSGTAMAGILANGYNSQLALGNAYRQAMESNRAQEQRVEEFNRGTNTTNSQGFLEAARANQAADMQADRMGYEATLAGNTLMDQIDARRSASMSANMTNLVNSLGQIGEEAYDKDRLDALIARGVLKDLYNNERRANGGMLTRPRKNNKRRK